MCRCCLLFFVLFQFLEVVVPAGSFIGRTGIIGGEIVKLGSVRGTGNVWLEEGWFEKIKILYLDWRIDETMSELAKVEIAQKINLSNFFDSFSCS